MFVTPRRTCAARGKVIALVLCAYVYKKFRNLSKYSLANPVSLYSQKHRSKPHPYSIVDRLNTPTLATAVIAA